MKMNRRSFITKGAAGAALFSIMPREVLGKMGGNNSYIAPSDQLTRGLIGVGGIGRSASHFVSDQNCRLVALCDVGQKHLDSAVSAASLLHPIGTDSCRSSLPMQARMSSAKSP